MRIRTSASFKNRAISERGFSDDKQECLPPLPVAQPAIKDSLSVRELEDGIQGWLRDGEDRLSRHTMRPAFPVREAGLVDQGQGLRRSAAAKRRYNGSSFTCA